MRLLSKAEADILDTAEERRGMGWGGGEGEKQLHATYKIDLSLRPCCPRAGQRIKQRQLGLWDLLACRCGYIADLLSVM